MASVYSAALQASNEGVARQCMQCPMLQMSIITKANIMNKLTTSILNLALLWVLVTPAWAAGDGWEYQVVILQGVTAGGSIKKQASGVSIDTKKTEVLNELAAQGWEVVAVLGAPVADHAVYLRRKQGR